MNHKVAIIKVGNYEVNAVEDAIEILFTQTPASQRITEDTKILLKPNLLAKHSPEHAVTTHPEVLRGVIRACVRRGAQLDHIIVADSAGGLYNPAQMKSLYQGCGLTSVCKEEGVYLYTACQSSIHSVEKGKVVTEFEILKPVLEADFIINLPKLKSHVMTGMTAAVKNMFGIIPGLKKSEWHMRFPDKERFGEMLIDLLETIPPDMAILDGILAMEGDGPAGGTPRQVGVLMASEDMVNLDLALAYMIGLEPMRIPYLKAAYERNIGRKRFDKKDLIGEIDAFAMIKDWKLPASYQGNSVGDTDFAAFVPKPLRPIAMKLERVIAPHPVVTKSLCIGCGKCAEICSKDTIDLKNRKATIIKKDCIRCFCCHEVCPVKAIDVKQFKMFGL
ncbi:MAG: DUF362 domain-containing protein [Eubacteriales bacterium]